MSFQSTWSDDETAALRRLWTAGDSASKIGAQINKTRNAVLGRAHRLRLEVRGRPVPKVARHGNRGLGRANASSGNVIAARKARKGPPIRRYVERAPVFVPLAPPTTPPIRFACISRKGCRYIAGDPAGPETMMCGAPSASRHLCSYHLALCWVPAPKRAPRAA